MTAGCQKLSLLSPSSTRRWQVLRYAFSAAHILKELAVEENLHRKDLVSFPYPSPAMDDQAGPGVFFNNNNNSILQSGGKGPLPEGDGGEAVRAQYSIPGILHFLQHEWARFEVERAQWEMERAELQVRIADVCNYLYSQGFCGQWNAHDGQANLTCCKYIVITSHHP